MNKRLLCFALLAMFLILQCGKKGLPHPIQKPKQTTNTASLAPSTLLLAHEG